MQREREVVGAFAARGDLQVLRLDRQLAGLRPVEELRHGAHAAGADNVEHYLQAVLLHRPLGGAGFQGQARGLGPLVHGVIERVFRIGGIGLQAVGDPLIPTGLGGLPVQEERVGVGQLVGVIPLVRA